MKILAIVFCLFFNFSNACPVPVFASSESEFAKVTDGTILFKTSDTDLVLSSNIYFEIPDGYFVTIITKITSSVTKVKYGNFTGFVKSEKIKKVSGLPQNPTLKNVTFSIKDSASTQLRILPSTEEHSTTLQILPSGTKNIEYIGKVNGEIPPSGRSNIWYFCMYSPDSDPVSVYFGYVYSEKCENLPEIPKNHEFENELISTQPTNIEDEYIYLNGTVKTILIIIISLPILIIFLLLLFANKQNKSILQKPQILHKKDKKQTQNNQNTPNFPTYDFDDEDLL